MPESRHRRPGRVARDRIRIPLSPPGSAFPDDLRRRANPAKAELRPCLAPPIRSPGRPLGLDIAFDGLQAGPPARAGIVAWCPEVVAPELAANLREVAFSKQARGHELEGVDEPGDRQPRGVCDQQVHMVIFSIKFLEFGAHLRTHVAAGLEKVFPNPFCYHPPPIL